MKDKIFKIVDQSIYPLFFVVMVVASFFWGGVFKEGQWISGTKLNSKIKCIQDETRYDVFEVCYKIEEISRKVTNRLDDYRDKRDK